MNLIFIWYKWSNKNAILFIYFYIFDDFILSDCVAGSFTPINWKTDIGLVEIKKNIKEKSLQKDTWCYNIDGSWFQQSEFGIKIRHIKIDWIFSIILRQMFSRVTKNIIRQKYLCSTNLIKTGDTSSSDRLDEYVLSTGFEISLVIIIMIQMITGTSPKTRRLIKHTFW